MAEVKQFEIPLLSAKDVECRVQSVSKNKAGRVGAVLLIYKDARVDMRILDQVFGPSNWQRTHEVINGNLFCNIDIWDDTKKAWIRKQDVGVESNTEKEKGQASDAFKRAGFNVGIGRELYTAPFIYVELADSEYYVGRQGQKEIYRCFPSTRFSVAHIGYNDRREITELVIVDRNGNVRFDMNGKAEAPKSATGTRNGAGNTNSRAGNQAANTGQQDASGGGSLCPECGGPISAAEQQYSMKKYGRELCRSCQKKA
jgi:hypothetical protein